MLSPARLLGPAAAAAAVAASLLFVAQSSASAAVCTTAPSVTVSVSGTTVTAKITGNACNDGVEAGAKTSIGGNDVTYWGGDVKGVGQTSGVTAPATVIVHGYRYWADKTGTSQWYNVPAGL